MKFLKLAIRSSGFASMILLAATGEVYAALILLISASMSLGIMLGEKMNGERK